MKVYIFHGWGATHKDNWFPWLKKELEQKGIVVQAPDFPDTEHPNLGSWIEKALELPYDENTVLVGHSLGSVLIMRLIEKGIKLKKAFLVANFDDNGDLNDVKDFFKEPFVYKAIKKQRLVMLSSDNDPYVPFVVADKLAKNLECEHLIYKGKRHLSNGTGSLKFPELLEMILRECD
ncbi:MAG: alpha/beta hydrolase [archaeon]